MSAAPLSRLIFLLLMFLPLPFLPEYGGANSSTRLMLTSAIVEQGTTRIDRHAALTVDKAEHDGHFYSDKAPGMALLAVPAYAVGWALDPEAAAALFRFDAPLEELPRRTMLLYRIIVWLTGGLLMALAGVALFRMCLRLGGSPYAALMATLSVCLASPFLGWSTQFFGHVAAGASLAIAFALSTGLGRGNTWLGPYLRTMVVGASLSLAVSIEYTAAPAALMVGLYVLWRFSHLPAHEGWSLFVLGLSIALLATAPMLIYHWVSFGSPFRVGYSSVVGFEGMQQGFLGLTAPDPVVLWKIIFGFKRGILWLFPLLVLVPWGLWKLSRTQGLRAESLLCLAVVVYYFLFNASYYYWNGGASVGPRHVMPALPFMALPLLWLWTHLKGHMQRGLQGLFALSLFFNIASASMTMTVPLSMRFPLKDPILENLLTDQNVFFRMADWGLSSLIIFVAWLIISLGLAVKIRHAAILAPKQPIV